MHLRLFVTIVLSLVLGTATLAHAGPPTLKIAMIDPLSGPFALAGEGNAALLQAMVEEVNAKGGVLGGTRLELITLDGKGTPQDSALALQAAIDQGARIVIQAASSSVASALLEGVTKHNTRNPDRTILYLNHGAIDPVFTEARCSFWHFRFDSHGHMKMEAVTETIAADRKVKRVYLINQDYTWGQLVSRDAKEMLTRKRPDIQVVGDDLHPLGKIKDFSPYVSKIRASGADTVITGNWGPDLALLIRAGRELGLDVRYYALYAYLDGAPSAIGAAGVDHVKTLTQWHANVANNTLEDFANRFKARFKRDYIWLPGRLAVLMLVKAIEQARSTEPAKIALALEGMRFAGPTGEVWMRADDHQIFQPLYVATFSRAGTEGVRYDLENTGFGWRTERRIEAAETIVPTPCRMERPAP